MNSDELPGATVEFLARDEQSWDVECEGSVARLSGSERGRESYRLEHASDWGSIHASQVHHAPLQAHRLTQVFGLSEEDSSFVVCRHMAYPLHFLSVFSPYINWQV